MSLVLLYSESRGEEGCDRLLLHNGRLVIVQGTHVGRRADYAGILVPGLMQVPEYARRVFAAGDPEGRLDVAAAIAARMDRQIALYDESRRFEFVIAEAALRWRIAPAGVMLAQIDRIMAVAGLSTVTLGLLPPTSDAWHEHGFNIMDDPLDGDPLVRIETMTRAVTITDPEEVGEYRDMFRRVQASALTGDEATELLLQIRAELLTLPR